MDFWWIFGFSTGYTFMIPSAGMMAPTVYITCNILYSFSRAWDLDEI